LLFYFQLGREVYPAEGGKSQRDHRKAKESRRFRRDSFAFCISAGTSLPSLRQIKSLSRRRREVPAGLQIRLSVTNRNFLFKGELALLANKKIQFISLTRSGCITFQLLQ